MEIYNLEISYKSISALKQTQVYVQTVQQVKIVNQHFLILFATLFFLLRSLFSQSM